MKFVWALVVVALCVMYMHAPGMEARHLHKRNVGDTLRPHGNKPTKQQAGAPPGAKAEAKGEKTHDEGDGQNNGATDRKKRSATDLQKIHPWPSTSICYKFVPSSYGNKVKKIKDISYTVAQIVEAAAAEWNDKSGLNIELNQNGNDCIEIKTVTGDGCWSWIGYQGQGRNEIVLEYPDCLSHGVILHEMGHALGLVHEAKRGDRVQYISVNSQNIQSGMEAQFTIDENAVGIKSTYSHSNEYDYCSIMHYSSTAFSSNGGATIDENSDDSHAEDVVPCMGSQLGLSLRDGEGAAAVYDTLEQDQDKVAASGCKYGGYLLKSDENTCRCSNLFEGAKCQDPKTVLPSGNSGTCGNTVIDLENDEVVTFKTPKFGSGNYPLNSKCTWAINAPEGKQICIAFPNGYKVEAPAKSGQCAFDWFEIVLDELLTLKTRRYCGSDGGWYSAFNTNFAAIVFESDEAYDAEGFEGAITYVDATEGDAECKTKIETQKSFSADVTTYEDYYDNLPNADHSGNDYYYFYYEYLDDYTGGFQSFNFNF